MPGLVSYISSTSFANEMAEMRQQVMEGQIGGFLLEGRELEFLIYFNCINILNGLHRVNVSSTPYSLAYNTCCNLHLSAMKNTTSLFMKFWIYQALIYHFNLPLSIAFISLRGHTLGS